MTRAEAVEDLRTVGRKANTCMVTVVVFALLTFILEAHALTYPRPDGGLGLDLHTGAI